MLSTLMMALALATAAGPRCGDGVQQATAQLKLADTAAARHDYKAANTGLDDAIRMLGSGYASPATNDDTGMHLVLARSQQRRGKAKLAAQLKRRILVERLQLCARPAAR